MTLADESIAWYDANARDLPWRQPETTPWGVLVSEVMLQQTPVVRVEPAWRSWMTRWPTPAALAADPQSEAIRMWGRLGYPRRAMRLHACAQAIVERHGGRVPDQLDQLLALPGVGTYTGRAVATFAYGQRHPVVDTNVRRVVSRVVEGKPDAGPATTTADLVAMEELLPEDSARAARASIAFMELGAIVCTARAPRCADCPFHEVCAWRLSGEPLPEGPSRKPQRYAGTDRQVRGLLLEVLRHATGPVPRQRLDVVWADEVQRARALAGLVEDGLVEPLGHEDFVLAGDAPKVDRQIL
ncbi:adenine glycosylase [Actinoplanes sp. SE50]|uniref:A/G-specific adenine glycosylase n=1 Tax=unclassified Actinoplanes TaxID=2626549 RepID=UPI00023EDFF3|nr:MULTISPECIES: A/G-specific adenine glycosylase [unclassified Actinoplanes]AEV88929.1 A/G-specific adenine glycosylase [Actinoplanes sp. SE50/110]ATO87335.1 adenine glycosylase [Actinoplanes sp. SE50]SLM04753.1 adenine glycosylase [Actinoplanes sp. SE50/110]